MLFILAFVLVLAGMAQQKAGETAIDPVCGMTVHKAMAKATFEYKGTTYYFCAEGCKDAFAKDPEKYLAKTEETKTGFTCPLHSADVEIKIENSADGVSVKISSQNPETVKKIQQHFAAGMKNCPQGCCAQKETK
jgi:Cu+-exporting ATPase